MLQSATSCSARNSCALLHRPCHTQRAAVHAHHWPRPCPLGDASLWPPPLPPPHPPATTTTSRPPPTTCTQPPQPHTSHLAPTPLTPLSPLSGREAVLTGESMPVEKVAHTTRPGTPLLECRNLCFMVGRFELGWLGWVPLRSGMAQEQCRPRHNAGALVPMHAFPSPHTSLPPPHPPTPHPPPPTPPPPPTYPRTHPQTHPPTHTPRP